MQANAFFSPVTTRTWTKARNDRPHKKQPKAPKKNTSKRYRDQRSERASGQCAKS